MNHLTPVPICPQLADVGTMLSTQQVFRSTGDPPAVAAAPAP